MPYFDRINTKLPKHIDLMGIGNRANITIFFYKPLRVFSLFLTNAFLLEGNLLFDDIFYLLLSDHFSQGQLIILSILPATLNYLLNILGVVLIGYFFYKISCRFLTKKQPNISNDTIKKINAAKLKFFTNIEKDYATPLNLIINPTKGKISNESLPIDLKGLVKAIENREQEISKIKGTDFNDQTTFKQKLTLVEGDLGDFMERTIRTFQAYSLKKELRFSIDIPPNSIMGWYDPTIVERILINLLTAVSDRAEKGVKVMVRMSLKMNDLAIFEISSEDQITTKKSASSSKFRQFFAKLLQLPTKNDLKLYLSKQLIYLQKGAIELYSPITLVNHYTLLLPIGKANYGIAATKAEMATTKLALSKEPIESVDKPSQVIHKQTLLVVDDNSEIRRFITEIFSETFQILKAENGIIGYDLAVQHIPDIIITDVMMPGMTGFELTAKLKNNEQTNHIPLILLTALNDFESQKTGYEEGGDVYISKPFSPQLLKLQVNNLIATKRKKVTVTEGIPIIDSKVEKEEKVEEIDTVDQEFLQTINEYLEGNYGSTELNVHALAKATFMSYIQFYRRFKAITGINAKEYIRTFRLKKAATFLQNDSEKSVNEIMHKVGFSGQSYFSASFKKQFGVTPSEFKANNIK